MTVMGEGKSPGVEHLRALAKKHDLRNGEVILAEVQTAITAWSQYADAAGLTKKAAKLIGDRIAPPVAKVTKPKVVPPKPKRAAAAKPRAKARKRGR